MDVAHESVDLPSCLGVDEGVDAITDLAVNVGEVDAGGHAGVEVGDAGLVVLDQVVVVLQ